jgi:hypothetical protein
MELYFETYVILALFFLTLGFIIAGLFLKNGKQTIWLSALVLFLGFFSPYGLIVLQWTDGSLGKIDTLLFTEWLYTENITSEHFHHMFIDGPPLVTVAWRCFMHHIIYLFVAEVAGLVVGVLTYMFYRKRVSK